VTPPAVGGMRRETVEDRVVRRWEGGESVRDEEVIADLTRMVTVGDGAGREG
jgi:hypothetical protein